MGVSLPLSIGAVVSAGAFGSNACFYGDTTVLSAQASGCNLFAHAWTQLPFAALAAAVSALVFVGLGYLL
jgi:Na+/H+ antiporter NhaC